MEFDMKHIRIAAVAAKLLAATSANAGTLSYTFTASADGYAFEDADFMSLTDTLAASFSTISGTLLFDDTFDSTDSLGQDFYAPVQIAINEFDVSGFGRLPTSTVVADDILGRDRIATATGGFLPDSAADGVTLFLQDDDATAISGSGFPMNLNLADFETAQMTLFSGRRIGDGPVEGDSFRYTITSLTPETAVVPLPAGLFLGLTGIAALGIARSRSGKRS
ncbi:MAG: VPLPA-CTERM sorting domain-containing protein [Pseudomonadota bacterium]